MARLFPVVLCLSLACAASGPVESAPGESVLESPTVGPIVARAESAMEQGDFDTAIQMYWGAFQRTPWNTRLRDSLAAAHAGRAARLRRESQFRELPSAEEDLRAALDFRPGHAEFERNLAVVLLERAGVELDPERAEALRAEALLLWPEAEGVLPPRRADLERRLDLAYELLERGQLDAGIQRLRALSEAEPQYVAGTRLLGRALVKKGVGLHDAARYAEAGAALDDAVQVYGALGSCAKRRCDDAELRSEVEGAHRNRIVAWLDAVRPARARAALEEAEQAGLSFPEFQRAVDPAPTDARAR